MAKLPDITDPRILQEIQRLERDGQTVAHRRVKVKPQLRDIPETGFIIGEDAGAFFIYTKINGKRFKAALILDP